MDAQWRGASLLLHPDPLLCSRTHPSPTHASTWPVAPPCTSGLRVLSHKDILPRSLRVSEQSLSPQNTDIHKYESHFLPPDWNYQQPIFRLGTEAAEWRESRRRCSLRVWVLVKCRETCAFFTDPQAAGQMTTSPIRPVSCLFFTCTLFFFFPKLLVFLCE